MSWPFQCGPDNKPLRPPKDPAVFALFVKEESCGRAIRGFFMTTYQFTMLWESDSSWLRKTSPCSSNVLTHLTLALSNNPPPPFPKLKGGHDDIDDWVGSDDRDVENPPRIPLHKCVKAREARLGKDNFEGVGCLDLKCIFPDIIPGMFDTPLIGTRQLLGVAYIVVDCCWLFTGQAVLSAPGHNFWGRLRINDKNEHPY